MHAEGRKTVRDLIAEEVRADPRSESYDHVNLAELLWPRLQAKYPSVHFAWGYFLRNVKDAVSEEPK